MSTAPGAERPTLASALAVGFVVLLTARLGLSVTVTPAAAGAAPRAPAAAAASAAVPQDPAAAPQGTRYYTLGRSLVREISGAVPAEAARLRLETTMGQVRLRPAAGTEVAYRILIRAAGPDTSETRRRLDRMAVTASRTGDLLLFAGSLPDRADANDGLGAEFDLGIPPTVAVVDVATGAGDIDAAGAPGAIGLVTQGGTITIGDLPGPLTAETHGGRIDVASVVGAARLVTAGGDVVVGSTGGALTVQTSGGDVTIGRGGGEVRVETGGGSVRIERAGGSVHVATSGGDIDVGEAAGEVTAATGGGGIRVGRAAGGVRCETAAGSIVLGGVDGAVRAVSSAGSIRALLGGGALPGDSDIQTWQGDVVVSLPESLPVTIRALVDNPIGQPIQSDFPLTVLSGLEGAGRPRVVREARVGGGGPVLKLRTLNGRIVILKVKDGQGTINDAAVQH